VFDKDSTICNIGHLHVMLIADVFVRMFRTIVKPAIYRDVSEDSDKQQQTPPVKKCEFITKCILVSVFC